VSNVTRLPPFAKTVRIEATIPASQRDEFDRAMIEIVAGERPRMDALDRDLAAIKSRADAALRAIEQAIDDNQARRLVRFVAGLYNGQDYPFDLTDAKRSRPASRRPLKKMQVPKMPRQSCRRLARRSDLVSKSASLSVPSDSSVVLVPILVPKFACAFP
jgi:hypothetical protein